MSDQARKQAERSADMMNVTVAELARWSDARVPKIIPADTQRYPSGCTDPDWCRGNRACWWGCRDDDTPPTLEPPHD